MEWMGEGRAKVVPLHCLEHSCQGQLDEFTRHLARGKHGKGARQPRGLTAHSDEKKDRLIAPCWPSWPLTRYVDLVSVEWNGREGTHSAGGDKGQLIVRRGMEGREGPPDQKG